MHTISKISEENLICLNMIPNFAKIGKVAHLSHATKKVARDLSSAPIVMGGKNNNFIQ